MGKQKENCKVFTPVDIVQMMLNILGYTKNLYGQKVLENSCGDGSFLVEIVRRYIEDSRRRGYNKKKIKYGLEQDICGFEIDEANAQACISNLDMIAKEYTLPQIKWNIVKEDVLKAQFAGDFKFIIGNPPYITYSALSVENREFIRSNYETCSEGKPDYYYAFIESALNHLSNNGKLVYLVPSNFFVTRFASKLRNCILPSLTDVFDYTNKKLFPSALTSSAIVVCDKNAMPNSVKYHDVVNSTCVLVAKEHLAPKWVFRAPSGITNDEIGRTRFGDVFPASSSIATLYNKAFLLNENDPDVLTLNEEEILRPAASPKSLANGKKQYIIFPYFYDNNGALNRYSDEDFLKGFPRAAEYLKHYKEELNKRDSDKSAKWFEYGRSQAIAHLNQEKLLLSTLVTNKVKIYELDELTIPYSGIYITQKNPDRSLAEAKSILESQDFFEYIKMVGIQANGSSIRISIKDINDYSF
ncbi:Eco57I restriction-modification methylase domain-containing protein [Desulfitobacterium hafniense]|uniref:Eco57I restriction-modification methylase domain-containing protein n=1 Tax=Desulfitobacterium hafniense TaxID=49338 RepID=UPI0003827D6D|nr:N-6 DNA methylase [Desulfitobacterium hafniense]